MVLQEGDKLHRRPFRAATYRPNGTGSHVGCDAASVDSGGGGVAGGQAGGDGGGHGGSGLTLEFDSPRDDVLWSPIDVEAEGDALRAVRVRVGPGELLFLPALWWHAVSQHGGEEGSTVAVNFWYEGPAALGDEVDAAADRAADRILQKLKSDSSLE